MFKKIMKIILSIIISLTILPSTTISIGAEKKEETTPTKTAILVHNGVEISSLEIEESEKEKINVQVYGFTPETYTWQISNDNSSWLNVYDMEEDNCEVSYALIKEIMNADNTAYVRCSITDNEEETINTSAIKVSVILNEATNKNVVSFAYNENIIEESGNEYGISLASDEFVTITVKFLDHTSKPTEENPNPEESTLYSPYVATIEYNTTSYKDESIIVPTFLGFAASYDENLNNQDLKGTATLNGQVFEINIERNITEDIVYKIYYEPIEVKYQVRYFFQNVNDDLYTENVGLHYQDFALTGTIITDDELTEHAGDTTGYSKLYHVPTSVAADGSTEFECYYDRNYYMIQFDLNGGYGVEPIYARYGTPFLVNNPMRAGYSFAGWDLLTEDTNNDGVFDQGDEIVDALPSTIPAGKLKYKAMWTKSEASATVVYWLQDAENIDEYSFFQAERVEGLTVDQKIKGSSYQDISGYTWYKEVYVYNSDKTNAEPEVTVKGDGSSFVNVYLNRKEITLRFRFAREYDGSDFEVFARVVAGNPSWRDDVGKKSSGWSTVTNTSNLAAQNIIYKTYTEGNYTYHFYEIKALYGADISAEWAAINNLMLTTTYSQYKLLLITSTLYFTSWRKDGTDIIGVRAYLDDSLMGSNNSQIQNLDAYLASDGLISSILGTGLKYYKYELYAQDKTGNDVLLYSEYNQNNKTSDQQKEVVPSFKGMKINEERTQTISSGSASGESFDNPITIKFYYEPDTYNLKFYNYNTEVDDMSVQIDYMDNISDAKTKINSNYLDDSGNIVPPYPNDLEKNAYAFAGWYTSPGCYEGTEVDWTNDTMPAGDLLLYAKWEKVNHTVKFFKTYDDMLAYESNNALVPYHTTKDIRHGDVINDTILNPTNYDAASQMEYIFAGWFYMENGVKKAFTPYDMPINNDMLVFADWSSNSPQPYKISYVLDSDKTTKIAEDTEGFAYCGSTRTFVAKAGNPYNQLYEEYNNGYFPTLSSHSITLQYESDKENPVLNVHTFYYVEATNIEYTIRYVNKETNVVMATETKHTSNSVVTERFKVFEGMVPDSFYKRLVISVEYVDGEWVGTDDNVITFYYTPNETSAYYSVHYMKEKLNATETQREQYYIDGSGGYEESGSSIEGIGTIDASLSITPLEFNGFELNTEGGASIYRTYTRDDNGSIEINGEKYREDINSLSLSYDGSKFNTVISKYGTEIYIFYNRKQFNYNVYYYEYNTTTSLADKKTGIAYYESSITEDAINIEGFTCVSSQTSQTKEITDNTTTNTENLNDIIFYYAPKEYVAEYIVVPEGGGMLSNTIEVIIGSKEFEGSIPTASDYYEFDGWYLDEECSISASSMGTIDDTTKAFIPDKNKISDLNSNKFYAKFRIKAGSLTIVRSDATEDNQIFVYSVKNEDTNKIVYVTIRGNNSVTIHGLVFGDYTITQLNEWAWRYNDNAVSYSHESANSKVEFVKEDDEVISTKWLNGHSSKKIIGGN